MSEYNLLKLENYVSKIDWGQIKPMNLNEKVDYFQKEMELPSDFKILAFTCNNVLPSKT